MDLELKKLYARAFDTPAGKCFSLVVLGPDADRNEFDVTVFHARSMRTYIGKGLRAPVRWIKPDLWMPLALRALASEHQPEGVHFNFDPETGAPGSDAKDCHHRPPWAHAIGRILRSLEDVFLHLSPHTLGVAVMDMAGARGGYECRCTTGGDAAAVEGWGRGASGRRVGDHVGVVLPTPGVVPATRRPAPASD
ncbi:hypothetical protein Vretimale_16626 [Volvox reticuliferus]|uniref:Uncharacterized protein n=1 Tax=Volvox reticuliferus TaxID=1737510 RepID=A0A8J4GTC2_9CHLO|nr:hypothetical protein Vretimale_16626 [Volvox reticuliferus]